MDLRRKEEETGQRLCSWKDSATFVQHSASFSNIVLHCAKLSNIVLYCVASSNNILLKAFCTTLVLSQAISFKAGLDVYVHVYIKWYAFEKKCNLHHGLQKVCDAVCLCFVQSRFACAQYKSQRREHCTLLLHCIWALGQYIFRGELFPVCHVQHLFFFGFSHFPVDVVQCAFLSGQTAVCVLQFCSARNLKCRSARIAAQWQCAHSAKL